MSMESVSGRIAAIEARLRSLEDLSRPAAPLAAPVKEEKPGAIPTALVREAPRPFSLLLSNALSVRRAGPSLPPYIESLVRKHAAAQGLNPNLLRALVIAESGGRPNAVSPKGAMGLTQLMPGLIQQYGIQDPFDPDENLGGGARYLAEKLNAYNGNLDLALAAYNAGSGAVARAGGVPGYPETQGFIRKIKALMQSETFVANR